MKAVVAVLGVVVAAVSAKDEGPKLRGVSPEFSKFYQDTDGFTCISNPSLRIPASRINDDFCDCPDGSDEPGTAACAHLLPWTPHTPADATKVNTTLALPGFYCENKGHIPAHVPFTSVNDGVCDYDVCCDGSEEWQGVGGVRCENRCEQIGREWRKQDELRRQSLDRAQARRKQLIEDAGRLRKEVEDRIRTIETEISAGEVKVKDLEAELASVEKKERARASGKRSRVTVLAGLAKQRTEELRNALLSVVQERDAAQSRLRELESLLTTFKEEYNPNFNDEGVKRAVRAWEDYAARDKGSEFASSIDQVTRPDKENGLDWAEYEQDDEPEAGSVRHYALLSHVPIVGAFLDESLYSLRLWAISNGLVASPSTSTSTSGTDESPLVREAKNRLNSAQQDLNTQKSSLETHRNDLSAGHYGENDIFRALKGTCVSTDSGEYTYELCFMEHTTQKPKKGGGHVNMGNYVRLETVTVDEDLPADGKGLGSGERIAMKFENGQHCWNGPSRSTTAILACAEQNELWKVREEEKCVYRLEVGTPAACEEPVSQDAVKDEL
ncbi:protein kinase-like protein C substrate [Piedraia hortae CBS 480.64]|uniref:Glucosidase 2 subunit beta n=1 Tax=Piedraia hortae CBS 480.64 TaxID=1314780 RepID=A0A6A7C8D8_9PEZI|nr:protein kinase-like protein C substrate [Piedraia hortae CBS 480.64]